MLRALSLIGLILLTVGTSSVSVGSQSRGLTQLSSEIDKFSEDLKTTIFSAKKTVKSAIKTPLGKEITKTLYPKTDLGVEKMNSNSTEVTESRDLI